MNMNRILFLLLTVFMLILPFRVVFAKNHDSGKQKRPNIIFILADDQAYWAAGFNGNKEVKTPNLDKLAGNGIVFDNYYNTTAICMASRAEIMTGMMEYKTACNFMHGSLTKAQFKRSYPILLKKAGYDIAFAGKFGYPVTENISDDFNYHSYEKLPVKEFDNWAGGVGQTEYETAKNKYIEKYAGKYPHSTRAYGAWASDYLRSRAKEDKPFCLSISFKAPHRPNTPDPFFDDIYAGIEFSYPQNYGRENGMHLAAQARNGRQWLTLFEKYGFSPGKFQESLRKYYQLIYGVDYAVGMILDALKENGLDENTIIIYTSDNGYYAGQHGFGGKVLPYEEGTKAPFIFYDPRNKNMGREARSRSLTANIDIAPTILELAGVKVPENMDGKSILPVVNDPKKRIREYLPVVNMWGAIPTHNLSIQTVDMAYIFWPYEDENMKPVEELFDKVKDPLQMKNVLNDDVYRKQLEKLRSIYDKQVETIKKEGVEYNHYRFYKTFFDRNVSWAEKSKQIPKPFVANYQRTLRQAEAAQSGTKKKSKHKK